MFLLFAVFIGFLAVSANSYHGGSYSSSYGGGDCYRLQKKPYCGRHQGYNNDVRTRSGYTGYLYEQLHYQDQYGSYCRGGYIYNGESKIDQCVVGPTRYGHGQGYGSGLNTGYGQRQGHRYNSRFNGGYGQGYGQSHDSGYGSRPGRGPEQGYDHSYDSGYNSGSDKGPEQGYGQSYDSGYNSEPDRGHGQSYGHEYNSGQDSGRGHGYDQEYDFQDEYRKPTECRTRQCDVALKRGRSRCHGIVDIYHPKYISVEECESIVQDCGPGLENAIGSRYFGALWARIYGPDFRKCQCKTFSCFKYVRVCYRASGRYYEDEVRLNVPCGCYCARKSAYYP